MTALTLNLSSLVGRVSDRDLEALSSDNPDALLETNSQGQLIFIRLRPCRQKNEGRRREMFKFSSSLLLFGFKTPATMEDLTVYN